MATVKKETVTTYSIEDLSQDEYNTLVSNLGAKVSANTAAPTETELYNTLNSNL